MVGFETVEGFDWDSGNDRKSVDKHGVTRAEAEQVFFNQPLLVLDDCPNKVLKRVLKMSNLNCGNFKYFVCY